MKHSNLAGGSTIEQRLNCQGSYRLELDAPEQPESDYAAEGSMLHAVIEILMMTDGLEPKSMIGFEAFGHTCTFDHLNDLELAMREWNRLADKFGIVDYDCEVSSNWEAEVPGAFGSIDLYGTGPTHNISLDWKFGKGIKVSAKNNYQGRFYAAGAMIDPSLKDLCNPDLPTVIAVVQPRIADGTSYEVVEADELRAFIQTVKHGLAESLKPDAPLTAGKWCRWCKAAATCPVKLGLVENLPSIDSGEMSRLLDLAEEATSWAKAVEALAHADAKEGHLPPGWKLVSKRATRKWIDEDNAKSALRGAGYRMKVADITVQKLRTPPQIEKILKGKPLPPETVTRVSSGTALVRDSDKRPAILSIAKSLADLGNRT